MNDGKTLAEHVATLAASTAELVREAVGDLVPIEKRHGEQAAVPVAKLSLTQNEPLQASNVQPGTEEEAALFNQAQALVPPYDPGVLLMLFEQSNALGSNVDAYKTNIESFGHHFDPVFDLDANDADEKIGDAIYLERLTKAAADEVPQAAYPTPDEIENRKLEIRHLMRLERAKLDTLFDEAVPDSSFVALRVNSRVDLEVTGNAYWEAIRNGAGDVVQFTLAPSYSMRLLPQEHTPQDVRVRTRVSALAFEYTTKRLRFRRFVQVVMGRVMFFKEYGDPRVMSSVTGRFYGSLDALKEAENRPPATEIVHFRIFSPRSPYGIPRWIGNMLAVLGSRASEEVNCFYFDNKTVPPMAVLVSGGRLAPDAKTTIENHVSKHIKGRNNFHRILIIEAESGNAPQGLTTDGSRVRIELKPLTEAQQKDALFQEYDANNREKIGGSFRVPKLLRGDASDINRATADATLVFTEQQVFQPERTTFDDFVNRRMLAPSGVRFWKFVSNSAITNDPVTLSAILTQLTTANILTPAEARDEATPIFNHELKKNDADWTKQPLALTLAGILPPDGMTAGEIGAGVAAQTAPTPPANADGTPAPAAPAAAMTPEQRSLASVAANLSALRDRMRGAEKHAAEKVAKADRQAFDEGEVIEIRVPKAEIDSWMAKDTDDGEA